MALEQGLLKDAEIKSLQAQVNPHFLFNAINTISALMRFDSEKARHLLLQLGHYFRANINSTRQNLVSIETELNHLEAYLTIEQARFPNRYDIMITIPEDLKSATIPPFLIQILVENALKHAFVGRKSNNKVWVEAQRKRDKQLELVVRDNGQGIELHKLKSLGKEVVASQEGTGSALENLNKRLISLYGDKAFFDIKSSQEGSCFTLIIPLQQLEEEK